MFALHAAMKFGIEAFSEKTGVIYYCSSQSDETNLHLILQNVHENIKKHWFLSPSGGMFRKKLALLCFTFLS